MLKGRRGRAACSSQERRGERLDRVSEKHEKNSATALNGLRRALGGVRVFVGSARVLLPVRTMVFTAIRSYLLLLAAES
jgi:hypothetical protein